MRKTLLDLINNSLIYKYDLPNQKLGIVKSNVSNINDKCYSVDDDNSLASIIYNSIIDYSFNEYEIKLSKLSDLHTVALASKIRYTHSQNESSKLKYGFYGEIILYVMLKCIFNTKPIIARGYFYNPTSKFETTGYDSYHLIENNGISELWFGEVKFSEKHEYCIDSSLKNVDKTISDSYLESNVMALVNHKNNLNIQGSKIEAILDNWLKCPSIKIIDEIKKHSMSLIYPILILYNEDVSGYDQSIKNAIEYINNKYKNKTFNLSIPYSIYFIVFPVTNAREIKKQVIKWIENKEPLI